MKSDCDKPVETAKFYDRGFPSFTRMDRLSGGPLHLASEKSLLAFFCCAILSWDRRWIWPDIRTELYAFSERSLCDRTAIAGRNRGGASLITYSSSNHRPCGFIEEQSSIKAQSLLKNGLVLAFCISLGLAAATFSQLSIQSPHGGWDAWAIWNVRARFLFRGAAYWTDAFVKDLAHSGYPLLLPSNIARGWMLVGSDTVLVPILLAAVFTFGIVGLMVSALALTRDASQGLLAGVVLSATPFFISHGASQYADVPLAFYFLSFVVTLSLIDHCASPRLFFLLGLIAGFAAWVKNEGWLFLLCSSVCLIVAFFKRVFSSLSFRTLGWYVCGLLPGALLVLHFKTQVSPGVNRIVRQSAEEVASKLLDVERYWTVFKAFFVEMGKFGGWIVSLQIVLLIYLLLIGPNPNGVKKEVALLPLALISLMALGFYLVYIITPHDLDWHLRTSLNRLLLQLWPSAVFLYFQFVRTPLEAQALASGDAQSPLNN